MKEFYKIINLKGTYFTRTYEKKKKSKTKERYIQEYTVAKFFKEGDSQVTVINQETGKEIVLTVESDKEDIKKYLGEKFL